MRSTSVEVVYPFFLGSVPDLRMMAGRRGVKTWTQPLGRQRHATAETAAVYLMVWHPYMLSMWKNGRV